MENVATEQFFTIGSISSRYGKTLHQVTYALRSRKVAPVFNAGAARVFAAVDVERLAREMHWTGGSEEKISTK